MKDKQFFYFLIFLYFFSLNCTLEPPRHNEKHQRSDPIVLEDKEREKQGA